MKYRIAYTDRSGAARRPWTVTAGNPVEAARSGMIDTRPARWAVAHMYGRNGVAHERLADSLTMTDCREMCTVTEVTE